MQDKLLAEFPSVSYAAWRQQVEKDLKGGDFDKRLVTRTLDGVVTQPLYTESAGAAHMADAVSGTRPDYDVRAEQTSPDPEAAATVIREDLASGATSLWLRFDARTRTGDHARSEPDGIALEHVSELAKLLDGVDLERTPIALDAGGNVALLALYLAWAQTPPDRAGKLRGSLGCDPLGALARDGSLPFALATARDLVCELAQYTTQTQPQLRSLQVASDPYHLAGATAAQELAYVLATGAEYLRWLGQAGVPIDRASAQLGFRVTVASDLFIELAKLRALRLCWAKIIAAHGGDAAAQTTEVHALTSLRTKTRRDPWVNMLRSTTEAFSALVGGANSVTARAFDVAIGHSDAFARRIARNIPIILSEESHANRVADAAGGSYYVESLTDELSRAAWKLFQEVEQHGGMSAALSSGAIARDVAKSAEARSQAIAKRLAPITGVTEFAHLSEEPVRRAPPQRRAPNTTGPQQSLEALARLTAARGERIATAVTLASAGATLSQLTAALGAEQPVARAAALQVHRAAEAFESLRDRADRHAAQTGQAPRIFLCNLGAIPKHKARSSFATGFFNAGGIEVVDNDGFQSEDEAQPAFKAAGTDAAIICGSDEQYAEWVPRMAAALRRAGARHVLLAGRPADQQASYEQAGVNAFIFLGVDVIATLQKLLDGMGVAQ